MTELVDALENSGSMKLGRVHLPTLKVGDRVRTDLGDLDELEQSIRDRGLLQPLVVNRETHLLAGYRRYVVLRRLGWEHAPRRLSGDQYAVMRSSSGRRTAQTVTQLSNELAAGLIDVEKHRGALEQLRQALDLVLEGVPA